VFEDPISQGPLKANVAALFFRFEPFVSQYFFSLGQEVLIESGILEQIIALRACTHIARLNSRPISALTLADDSNANRLGKPNLVDG